MASTFTPLGVELQATGENAGTWGNKTNVNLQLIEQISGGFTAQAISSANTDPNGYGSFEYPTQGGYAICTKNLAEFG